MIYKSGFDKKDIEALASKALDEHEVVVSPIYLSLSEVKEKMCKLDSFILRVLDEGVLLYGDEKWLKRQ